MRRGCLALFAASLVACFSPSVDTDTESNDATDSEPGTSSEPPSEPTTTEDPGSASTGSAETGFDETETSPTGPDDAPPQFESFTVNGSDTPAEVNEGGSISLEASVSDDLGIASVEFFDGRTSLGIVDTPPYELDVLVSSADSGSHTYRAVATDTGDQSAESEGVMLSINIVGGEVEFLREDLFRGTDFAGLYNGGTNSDIEGRVLLSANEDGSDASRIIGFDRDLSQQWNRALEEEVVFGPTAGRGSFFIGGSTSDGSLLQYSEINPATGATIETSSQRVQSGFGLGILRYWNGGLLLRASDSAVSFRNSLVGRDLWQLNVGDVADIESSSSHAFISIGDNSAECATGSRYCVQKVAPDGVVLWTTGIGNLASGTLAAKPDGGVFAAVLGGNGDGIEIFELGPNGAVESTMVPFPGDTYTVADLDPDGYGGVVVAAAEGPYSDQRAIVIRLNASGEVEWDQRGILPGNTESSALSAEVKDSKVYVYGLRDMTSSGFGLVGDAWIARLAL